MHLSSFEEVEVITHALRDPEWSLGKQADLIANHRPLIHRLREAGYLQQNGDTYSLKAAGYSQFRRLA
jgi:predicted xylose isomerase-like sugar epimerase